MDAATVFTILIAVISTVLSIFALRESRKAREFSIQVSTSESILHFTDRFFDLLKDIDGGIVETILKDRAWEYQFWSLQATEFYFFHHGILPTFMYSLWMVDLAEMYVGTQGQSIRDSHEKYLARYSLNYDAMNTFFSRLYELAITHSDPKTRNQEIATWIAHWIAQNRRDTLR